MKLHRPLLATIVGLPALSAAQAQDATAGKSVFAHCSVCHSTDGSTAAGSSLKGIVGRTATTATEFRHSRALKGVGYPWDARSLDAFIADPQTAIPGNLMPFSGLLDASARANLIAYLETLQ